MELVISRDNCIIENVNKKITTKSWLENIIYNDVSQFKNKKKKKIANDDFYILNYSDWMELENFNYNCNQLKKIASHYKIKKSGNKNELLKRVYNYLKFSHYSLFIQKIWRGYLRRKYNSYRGPAIFNRKTTNDRDFLTFEKMGKISYKQFFSYKDNDGFIYGFDLKSITNLFKHQNELKNPYTRKIFPKPIVDNIRHIIKISNILNEKVDIIIQNTNKNLSQEKKIELKIISLFHKIDSFGHITDTQWFTQLEKPMLIKYIRELHDIWNYRAQLSNEIKYSICPPNGNPFPQGCLNHLSSKDKHTLQKYIIRIIENMISKSNNRESQSLGAFYVLGAFTLVDQNAAAALPWLYQSVHYSP